MKAILKRLKARVQSLWKSKAVRIFAFGFAAGVLAVAIGAIGVALTSSNAFCMSCHEMRVVAEQGWMHSKHYNNRGGVVAGCSDCHVPPSLFPKLWVKTRDGLKDVWVHFFGQSDPTKMDWEALAKSARSKIYQSSCEKCHQNLEPEGASLKALVAHRENKRAEKPQSCLECHVEEFHGRFKQFLTGPATQD